MKATIKAARSWWHGQQLALCCLLSTAPTICQSFTHSCAHTCIHLHVHAFICMSKHPSVCMFMTSFSHFHEPGGPEQAPLIWALLLQSIVQKQNHAVCSSHAWQGHVCCLQLPHPNGGLKTSLYLVPITVTTYYCAPSRAAAPLGFSLGRLPLAEAIACLIFSCRQKMP